jgi:hypothetical protein
MTANATLNRFFDLLRQRQPEVAEELIQAEVDVNVYGQSSGSPLHDVIWLIDDDTRRLSAVRLLLERGANPNKGSLDDEYEPMAAALLRSDTEIMRLLLAHGADPNTKQEDFELFYDWAEFEYRFDTYDLRLPEEPTPADKVSEDAWLKFLDRVAVKYAARRPDYLHLLRQYGAKSGAELQQG